MKMVTWQSQMSLSISQNESWTVMQGCQIGSWVDVSECVWFGVAWCLVCEWVWISSQWHFPQLLFLFSVLEAEEMKNRASERSNGNAQSPESSGSGSKRSGRKKRPITCMTVRSLSICKQSWQTKTFGIKYCPAICVVFWLNPHVILLFILLQSDFYYSSITFIYQSQ